MNIKLGQKLKYLGSTVVLGIWYQLHCLYPELFVVFAQMGGMLVFIGAMKHTMKIKLQFMQMPLIACGVIVSSCHDLSRIEIQ